ncbi:MAG: hypothetical protein E7J82_06875, partial [Veillonella sp.]|nr:hypothetical protein [Veillonella sp.]
GWPKETRAAALERLSYDDEKIVDSTLEVLTELDAVIIGGSAGGMTGIMDEAQRLLKVGGRLVVTAVTMETGYTILKELKGRPFTYEGYQMSISRYRKAGPYHLLDPLSPIFIVSATRIAEGE